MHGFSVPSHCFSKPSSCCVTRSNQPIDWLTVAETITFKGEHLEITQSTQYMPIRRYDQMKRRYFFTCFHSIVCSQTFDSHPKHSIQFSPTDSTQPLGWPYSVAVFPSAACLALTRSRLTHLLWHQLLIGAVIACAMLPLWESHKVLQNSQCRLWQSSNWYPSSLHTVGLINWTDEATKL
jgi:hypothetical protein